MTGKLSGWLVYRLDTATVHHHTANWKAFPLNQFGEMAI
jgi:hypothetical protein